MWLRLYWAHRQQREYAGRNQNLAETVSNESKVVGNFAPAFGMGKRDSESLGDTKGFRTVWCVLTPSVLVAELRSLTTNPIDVFYNGDVLVGACAA
jgi:hypothetical protein